MISLQWVMVCISSLVIVFHRRKKYAGKRLRDDAKQCKIVLLRYAKALDNIIVIKCN